MRANPLSPTLQLETQHWFPLQLLLKLFLFYTLSIYFSKEVTTLHTIIRVAQDSTQSIKERVILNLKATIFIIIWENICFFTRSFIGTS